MIKSVVSVALLALAFPAFAQSATPKGDTKAKDPNRKICETILETGSRLGGTRVCMTAQQWEEQRRTQRADLERAQQNTGINNGR